MDEENNVKVTETDAEDSGFGGVFAESFDDDLEEEVIEQPAEEEPGEVTEETSESNQENQPEAQAEEQNIETSNDDTQETVEEPTEEPATEAPVEQYELNHGGKVSTVTRDEVVVLAQKGLDYDRIKTDRDTVRAENDKLKAEHDFLQELADSSKMTVEQLIDETRADIISKRDGTRKEVALQQVRAQRESKTNSKMAESLQKILDISPKWLACGHGLPVRFADAKPVIQAYLWAHNK